MYTDIRFVNKSLNANVREIGVFFGDMNREGDEQSTPLWRIIKHCGFLWEHPFRIQWHQGLATDRRDCHQLNLCADMRLQEGEKIMKSMLNASHTHFDIPTLRSATIYMKGGAPGSKSTPIEFYINHMKYW